MPLSSFDQAKVDQFFAEIAPFTDAYQYAQMRYMAVRGKTDFCVHLGAVELSAFTPPMARDAFETPDMRCEVLNLHDLGLTSRSIVNTLLSGTIAVGSRAFVFPPELSGAHRAYSWSFDGSQNDSRSAAGHLVISGANDRYMYLQQAEIFRQLKESEGSYESPAELAADFGLKLDHSTNVHFDILAGRVAQISGEPRLDGEHLTVRLRLAKSLDPILAKLGVVFNKRDGTRLRIHAAPDSVRWERMVDGEWCGTFDARQTDIESATCVLSYAALVQHQAKLGQPMHRINALRFIHDLYDPEGEGIARIIREQKVKGRDPQKFELAVGALLGMRGFALASFDRIPKLEEAPDILAVDGRGNILVVECTLDPPNGENKLTQASRKALAIRHAFLEQGRNDINVVAVLATSRTVAEIDSYRIEAQKQRVLLWSREDIDVLRRDTRPSDANAFFDGLMAHQAMLDLLEQTNVNVDNPSVTE